jgi:pilus assembly protein CpaF
MTMYNESLRAFLKPILQYLDDESVSEVMINGPEDIWIERKGRLFKTDARFSEEGLMGAARNMAQYVGRVMSDERPRLDARLPDGSRIHVVLPPIARQGTTISIRKFFKDRLTPERLVSFGSITAPMLRLIEAAVRIKQNMVVSGGTGSGKTTLLNVLSGLIPDEERILTIEDSAELQLQQQHLVAFESRPADKLGKGEVNMGHLLHSALRMRPDRIIVGEVRGGEAFDLMQAMNTGHGGSMSTVHANTPTDSLRRIEALCLMSAVEMPMVAVRAQVASAIQFIVCCERLPDGSRKTIAISEVLPLNEKGEYRTQDLWLYIPVARGEDGQVLGYHAPTGILPTFLQKARAYGFEDLTDEFFDPASYGVPPPPLIHGLGEQVTTHWVPSLKHRERGLPEPDDARDVWRAFEQRLKDEARSRAAAPEAAPAPPVAPKPTRAPPSLRAASRDDATPPPTRNPLLGRAPPRQAAPPGPSSTEAEADAEPEPSSVEVDDALLADVAGADTAVRENPLGAGRGRPGAAPLRPASRPLPPRRT